MTSPDRLESDLPQLLEHLYLGPRPTYADGALRTAVGSPRRRASMRPGLWQAMIAVSRRAAWVPRVPWRTILVVGLVAIALAAGAIVVGNREQALPPPTGPAGNGLITYAWRGDIYVGDPATGLTTAIATGPRRLRDPQFSPDGTHIAFVRGGDRIHAIEPEIVVVRVDGSEERVLGDGAFAWAPHGATLIFSDHPGGIRRPDDARPYVADVSIVDAHGTAEPRRLTPPLPRAVDGTWLGAWVGAAGRVFKPPSGDQILAGTYNALNVIDAESGQVARLGQAALEGFEPYRVAEPAWSPDASMILFGLERDDVGGSGSRIGSFVMKADGTDVRRLASDVAFSGTWSPDGMRVAYQRPVRDPDGPPIMVLVDMVSGDEQELAATAPAPGDPRQRISGWSWSPDGHSIIIVWHPRAPMSIVNVDTGRATELPWEADSPPSWQRVPLH